MQATDNASIHVATRSDWRCEVIFDIPETRIDNFETPIRWSCHMNTVAASDQPGVAEREVI